MHWIYRELLGLIRVIQDRNLTSLHSNLILFLFFTHAEPPDWMAKVSTEKRHLFDQFIQSVETGRCDFGSTGTGFLQLKE
jgi:hypothetical protein